MKGKRNTVSFLLSRCERDEESGCQIWQGGHDIHGYGQARWSGMQRGVHRLIWEQVVGPIPEGKQVHHSCRRRDCCNVRHMELVSPGEHAERDRLITARNAAKTHCVNGHPFDEENTGRDSRGHRRCRACHREKNRVWMAEHYRDLPSYQRRRRGA